jgi:hypothetical protein
MVPVDISSINSFSIHISLAKYLPLIHSHYTDVMVIRASRLVVVTVRNGVLLWFRGGLGWKA